MTETTAISSALQQRLETGMPEYTITFEADDSIPERPYITAQVVRLQPSAVMLHAHPGIKTGYLVATVVTERGKFATSGQDIGDQIADLFPFALRLPIGAREMTINNQPFVETGFGDGFDWRTPVRIDYEVS